MTFFIFRSYGFDYFGFLTNARRDAMRSKTQWVIYRDLDWWPGPQKVQFGEITGYLEVVGLFLALLRAYCLTIHTVFLLLFQRKFVRQHQRSCTFQFQRSPLGQTVQPSSIYSWSVSYILEHEFLCLGRLGKLRAVRIRKWIWVFLGNFWGCFFQFFVHKML